MSRCRSFLPDLMTVRAVMVRAAMEKKTSPLSVCYHPVRPMEVEQLPGELEWSDFVDSLRSGFLFHLPVPPFLFGICCCREFVA